jgi:uncharacterized protein (TIGR04255 family)
MPPFPPLKNPPIIEAQLNFQLDASAGWNRFGSPGSVAELFPSHPEVQALQQFVFQTNPPQAGLAPVHGFFLRNSSDPTVYQIRRDGFAFSRLSPYLGWESLVEPALKAWTHYQEMMQTGDLNGISLTFINRLEVPRAEFVANRDRYLTIAPRVPIQESPLPWRFAGFAHHSVYIPEKSRFQIAVALANDPGDLNPEVAAIMLEITVSPLPGVEIGTENLSHFLKQMRDLKNQAFFSITTEESRLRYT